MCDSGDNDGVYSIRKIDRGRWLFIGVSCKVHEFFDSYSVPVAISVAVHSPSWPESEEDR